MIDVFRYVNLRFELQHLFPSEIRTAGGDDALAARRLLSSINFNLESRGNKMALLASPGMRDALRNFAVNLDTLDEVNSTDDSTFRVELLTPAQFHFATSLGGIAFRPEMLSATYDNVTGQLTYTVNGVRAAGRYVDSLDADGNPVLVTYSDGTTGQAQEYQMKPAPVHAVVKAIIARGPCRCGAAANDNDAWREAAFRFVGWEMVA